MSNNKQYYKIYRILKQLGFKTNLCGTKLLIKVIIKAYTLDDYYTLNKIYTIISQETHLSVNDISILIFNSINSRKKDTSKKNFENVFGFEYDESNFKCKEFVENLVNIL